MDIPIKGKTVLVTGATNGIGLVTARELARMGAQVTIVSRNADKCAVVAEAIKTETGKPVEFIAADLSTLAGIMQTAAGSSSAIRGCMCWSTTLGVFSISVLLLPTVLK